MAEPMQNGRLGQRPIVRLAPALHQVLLERLAVPLLQPVKAAVTGKGLQLGDGRYDLAYGLFARAFRLTTTGRTRQRTVVRRGTPR